MPLFKSINKITSTTTTRMFKFTLKQALNSMLRPQEHFSRQIGDHPRAQHLEDRRVDEH